jgi:phenylacetate-CoA ligase
MSKILGRRDDMLVVRGVNVYPSEIEAVLMAQPGLEPHYVLVVDRRLPATELIVCCESRHGTRDELTHALHERLGLRAQVEVLAPGTLPRQEAGKAVRVLTWSEGPAPLPFLDGTHR